MLTALVLINVVRNRINETAEQIAALAGISEVYSVSGEYDLVAVLRVRDAGAMAEIVTNRLLKLEAIQRTHTMIAFRAYSRHDLDSLFSVGAE